jgi:hypothetical protein
MVDVAALRRKAAQWRRTAALSDSLREAEALTTLAGMIEASLASSGATADQPAQDTALATSVSGRRLANQRAKDRC